MNKSKDKHHTPEESKKNAREADPAAPEGVEPSAENQPAAEPADSSSQGAPLEHGAKKTHKTAEQEIEQLKDQLLRLRADFENYRKRALREKGEIYENANEALTLELLPVIDHLQLALKSAREHQADSVFQEGLQLIADQMLNTLAKYGLNPFSAEKQVFDPNLHEAISYLPSETEPEGTIIAQSRQGYRFNKKMLRPPQVVVSSGKPSTATPETTDKPAEE